MLGLPNDLSSFAGRLEDRRIRHRQRGVLFRALFAVAGMGVLSGGIVMLVLPGPGLLVTGVGLGMLALEFAWAEHLLSGVVARLQILRLHASRSRGSRSGLRRSGPPRTGRRGASGVGFRP